MMSKLYSETFGQGERVVMLHGWAMHSGVWREFAQEIAKNNQVTCIDLPGHGRSKACSSAELNDWTAEVVDVLPAESCHFIAWSLGGNIALDIAKKFPNRVKSMTLIASNPHFMKTQTWFGVSERVLEEFEKNLNSNIDATLFRFLTLQVQGMSGIKLYLKKIKSVMQEFAAPNIQVLKNGLSLLRCSDLRGAVQSISCPAQLILGSLDTLVPADISSDCKTLRPALECHIIEGAGHIPFITHTKETLEVVQNFIEQRGVR
ncbi:MAG: alpha/beta fold hydrolase [Methyloprofundus sp.]|nr:alpha/beta fold hydrolase [Methyloprofundus sp.]